MEVSSLMVSFYKIGCGCERDPYFTEYVEFNPEDESSREDAFNEAIEYADKAVRRGVFAFADIVVETVEIGEDGNRTGDDAEYSGVVAFIGDWAGAGFSREPEIDFSVGEF